MSAFQHSDLQNVGSSKLTGSENSDIEKQAAVVDEKSAIISPQPRSLGAGVSSSYYPCTQLNRVDQALKTALPIGVFATTLTTLSLSLMEWRGVTTDNVFIANFFFAAAFGLVITAQWELAIGNGFSYTVFSAFGEHNPRCYWLPLTQGKSRAFLCGIRRNTDPRLWCCGCIWRRYSAVQ